MERRIFHGNITPTDVAQALLAEFDRGNLHTQLLGESNNLTVQVATQPFATSGGQTGLAINIQEVEDGVMVQVGSQQMLGVAASLGKTAISVLSNPLNILGRLDDIAQDVQSLQLVENIWKVIGEVVRTTGASHQLSERLSRLVCVYCATANPVGEPNCIACGAPLGKEQPFTCLKCGFVVRRDEERCPNCGQML